MIKKLGKINWIRMQIYSKRLKIVNESMDFDDYLMESSMFNYDELKSKPNYKVKKFHDALYRG